MVLLILCAQIAWKLPLGDANIQILSAGDRVVVVADRLRYGTVSPARFVTVSARTGEIVSEFEMNLSVAPAFAAADGDAVFATDGDGKLLRLSLSGRVTWSAAGDWRACEPVIAGDRVVVAGPAGTAAFARETGERLWLAEGVGSTSDWVVAGAHVWVGGAGSVTALNPADGAAVWRAEVPAEWMRLAGGRLLCGGDGRISAVDAADGSVRWTAEVGRLVRDVAASDTWVAVQSAEMGDGVQAVFRAYRVTVFAAADGTRAWEVARGDRPEGVAVEGGVVYVGADALRVADGAPAAARLPVFPPMHRAGGLGFVVARSDGGFELQAVKLD